VTGVQLSVVVTGLGLKRIATDRALFFQSIAQYQVKRDLS
jgi:hypothetical protein